MHRILNKENHLKVRLVVHSDIELNFLTLAEILSFKIKKLIAVQA